MSDGLAKERGTRNGLRHVSYGGNENIKDGGSRNGCNVWYNSKVAMAA